MRCDGAVATLDDVLDHLVYMVGVVGSEHVALGTDLEGRTRPPAGLVRYAELEKIAIGLRARKLTEAVITRILRGNVDRLLEATARRPSKRE